MSRMTRTSARVFIGRVYRDTLARSRPLTLRLASGSGCGKAGLEVSWRAEFVVVAFGLPADCQDEQVRIDPDPDGAEFSMLSQYLDYQRETMLSKTDGLTREQLVEEHPPSELTLAGLLYHLSLVEEDWMEVRFAGRNHSRGRYWRCPRVSGEGVA